VLVLVVARQLDEQLLIRVIVQDRSPIRPHFARVLQHDARLPLVGEQVAPAARYSHGFGEAEDVGGKFAQQVQSEQASAPDLYAMQHALG
jgi:hypothetical protein